MHKNPNLTKTDKFISLRSYLTGAAAHVAGLPLTEANYVNDFQLLQVLVINAHMTKFLKQQMQ